MLIVAGLLLAVLAVLIVVEPVLRGVSEPAPVLFADSDDEVDPLQRRRDLALAALKEIEFDRATGKLSEDDYQRLRSKYAREAVEVMRDIEASIPSVPSLPSSSSDPVEALIANARAAAAKHGRRPRFCEECGAPVQDKGRFCAECGAALRV